MEQVYIFEYKGFFEEADYDNLVARLRKELPVGSRIIVLEDGVRFSNHITHGRSLWDRLKTWLFGSASIDRVTDR